MRRVINFLTAELVAKRLGLLRELLPRATRVAVLVNSADADRANSVIRDAEAAAGAMGLQLYVQNASTSREIDAALRRFCTRAVRCPVRRCLMCSSITGVSNLQTWQRVMRFQQVTPLCDYAEAGGLMSYGTDVAICTVKSALIQAASSRARSRRNFPWCSRSRFELVINLQTARMLGLEIPPTLLARADEVIE